MPPTVPGAVTDVESCTGPVTVNVSVRVVRVAGDVASLDDDRVLPGVSCAARSLSSDARRLPSSSTDVIVAAA